MDSRLTMLLVVLLAVVILLAFWAWRRSGRVLRAQDSADVEAKEVRLPDGEDDGEENRRRHRGGDSQKLKRRIVHGSYRPIEDPGAQTKLEAPRPPGDDQESGK